MKVAQGGAQRNPGNPPHFMPRVLEGRDESLRRDRQKVRERATAQAVDLIRKRLM